MLGPVLPHPRFRAGRHRRLVVAKSTRVKIRRILPDCASVAPQRGEKAAQPIVGIPAVGSALYLVSPDRGRSWVRNLENDPHLVLDPGGDPRPAVAAEPAQAAHAVAAYLQSMHAPWALRAFPHGPDAGLAEIIDHLDTIAVYRLDGAHGRHGRLA